MFMVVVVMMAMAMRVIMVMMTVTVGVIVVVSFLFRFSGSGDPYLFFLVSATACVAHNDLNYSMSNDLICNSFPLSKRLLNSWHSGQLPNIPLGV